ncbi:MAG: LysM peptidoglycan-binding domain-containing protein, partial [Rikenellaceae bacterium]
MNRSIAIILSLAVAAVSIPTLVSGASSGTDSESAVVYVDGARYHLHSVVKGDTLYSLAKRYGVGVDEITASNPNAEGGLSIGMSLKIPNKVEPQDKGLSDKKLRKTFDIHPVQFGETLYSISKRYEISIEMILEDNPSIDPASLIVGANLNIRKSEQGLTSESMLIAELDGYRSQLNRVAPEGLIYHLVEGEETMESLGRRFQMSRSQIEELNNLVSGATLSTGAIILVNDVDGEGQNRYRNSVGFEPLSSDETLEIALLLPLSIRGYALRPMVEFYRGFLLGVEDLKRGGRDVVVNLFNTERDGEVVERIIGDSLYQKSNLIVGPVYEELLPAVLSDAERRYIPVVSPLVTLTQEESNSPVLFQMAPDRALRLKKVEDLFADDIDEDIVVTMISGQTNDDEYSSMIEAFLIEQGLEFHEEVDPYAVVDSMAVDSMLIDTMLIDTMAMDSTLLERRKLRIYERFEYKYEHPSVITEREKAAEERIKLAMEEARLIVKSNDSLILAGLDSLIIPIDTLFLIDSLSAKPSPSDLTQLISRDTVTNIFFVTSNDETEVDRILSALASAYTAQAATLRGSGRRASEVFKFCVVSNPAWRQYENIDHSIYFRDRVIDLPTYLARRDSDVIREFDSRYGTEFSDFPSLY